MADAAANGAAESRPAGRPGISSLIEEFRNYTSAAESTFSDNADNVEGPTDASVMAATGGQVVLLDYESASIKLLQTSTLERVRASSCAKEPWTVKWIEEYVQPGQVLYDVGANVGAYSLVAAKSTKHQARIYAFEPGFANFSGLCENINLNGCASCITPIPIGLSAETQLTTFNYRDLRSGGGVHAMGEAPLDFEPMYVQPVLTFRLDQLVKEFRLPWPNHMKIDVDGMELDVIRGARECLTGVMFQSLMLELTGKRSGRTVKELERLGLHMVQQTEKRNKSGDLMSVWYGLFTRNPRARALRRSRSSTP